MELIPSAKSVQLQHDRRGSIQFPIPKTAASPGRVEFIGISDLVKARASSANPSKRNMLKLSEPSFMVGTTKPLEADSPRIVGCYAGDQMIPNRVIYDSMKLNARKVPLLSDLSKTTSSSKKQNNPVSKNNNWQFSPTVERKHIPSVDSLSDERVSAVLASMELSRSSSSEKRPQLNEPVKGILTTSRPLGAPPAKRKSVRFAHNLVSYAPEYRGIDGESFLLGGSRPNSASKPPTGPASSATATLSSTISGFTSRFNAIVNATVGIVTSSSSGMPELSNSSTANNSNNTSSGGGPENDTVRSYDHPVNSTMVAYYTANNTMLNTKVGAAAADRASPVPIPNTNNSAASIPTNVAGSPLTSGTSSAYSSNISSPTTSDPAAAPASAQTVQLPQLQKQSSFSSGASTTGSSLFGAQASTVGGRTSPSEASESAKTDVTSSVSSSKSNPLPSAGKPPVSSSSSGKKKPQRPSLSDQLASIGAAADAITTTIRQNAHMPISGNPMGSLSGDSPVLTMPARCFYIGTLCCKFPSPVYFYADRCEYLFNHPFEPTVVNMVMYYRDMTAINIIGTKFRFKLSRKLLLFLGDFDPSNPQHMITIEMASLVNVTTIKERIVPLISAMKSA